MVKTAHKGQFVGDDFSIFSLSLKWSGTKYERTCLFFLRERYGLTTIGTFYFLSLKWTGVDLYKNTGNECSF